MQDLYPSARSGFARGLFDWSSGGDNFNVALLDGTYTYSTAHDFRDDLTGVLATVALTGVSELFGVCDADDVAVPGVPSLSVVERVLIYRNVGSAATDDLIWYADTYADGTSIYRVSDGNPMPLSWSNGANRIFRI